MQNRTWRTSGSSFSFLLPLFRIALPALLALLALLSTAITGCRTAPPDQILEEKVVEVEGMVLHGVPPDHSELTTDQLELRIVPGALDPSLVEMILVQREPDTDREVQPRISGGEILFLLPLDELEDGGVYRFSIFLRLRDGRIVTVGEPFSLILALGLPRLEPDPIELLTLDPRPRLAWVPPVAWVPPGDADAPALWSVRLIVAGAQVPSSVERLPGTDEARAVVPLQDLASADAIRSGTVRAWQVRAVSPAGVLGPLSGEALLLYDPAASVPEILSARSGDLTLVSRPGFSWKTVAGAVQYEIEFGMDSLANYNLEDTRFRVPLEMIEQISAGGLDAQLRWRVRAQNSLGVTTPWSDFQLLTHVILAPAIVPVLPPGGAVRLTMGAPAGTPGVRANEVPPVDLLIDRPFGIARNLLTTELVAELFNQGLRRDELVLTGEGELQARQTGYTLLALRNLTFGNQLGLYTEAVAVLFRPEYRSHPAVGVSWYGAVWLMNQLSLLEARQPAYRWIRREDSWETVVDNDSDGYRLPTEAEWALAVGQRARLRPDTDNAPVTVRRALTPVELQSINFLRSGDAWEDPEPPFTRSGGPTNPAGALGNASAAGVYDLLGNVWEWVRDWYHPERSEAGVLPQLPDNYAGPDRSLPDIYGREMRVVRGGAWNTPRDTIRPTMRGSFAPDATSHSIGVRPVRTLR